VFPHERGTGHGRVTLTTSMISHLLTGFDGTSERVDALNSELRFLDDSESKIGTASVLECLSANLRLGDVEYIAYDGDFYVVDKVFVEQVDAELRDIPVSLIDYPAYRGETEPGYNSRVGRDYPHEFIELDRALIVLPGQYGVESSDLVSASGALIHVKRKGRSSVLSHLFLQAANSCELLRWSAAARDQLQTMLETRAHNSDIARSVIDAHKAAWQQREEIDVVFAFLGNWRGKTAASLPLFSRISLVTQARRIGTLGFRPTIALISS